MTEPSGNARPDRDEHGPDPGRTSLEVSSAPDVVRQTTIKVLTERIRLLGIDRSGAYEHYNLQLSEGFPIRPGERAAFELVRQRLPDLRSYHEIGSGMATLPLMLAYEGFASVGIERDDRRHLTATAILRELSADFPHVESNCRLFGADFPDAVADLDVSDSMAILTDFVSSQTPKQYVQLCHGLGQYRYVLLDLQRFCTKRETTDELERLTAELATYGLSPCEAAIDLESQGFYRLFECKPAEGRRGIAAVAKSATEPDARAEAVAIGAVDQAQEVLLPATVPRGELQAVPANEVAQPAPRDMILPPMPQRTRGKRFGGMVGLSALLVIGIPTILAVLYYGWLASSQYVTSFQFAVRGPSLGAARGGSAMGGHSGVMSPDSFVVTDYINGPQALADLERKVDVRAMFSRPNVDFWSRLPANASAEALNTYWSRVVSANFDLISGNISVSVRAFTPQESLALAQALVAASDEMFRKLNARAQEDFLRIADDNVARVQSQLTAARDALFVFREEGGLVDPDKTAQAGAAIVDDLRKQLAGYQAQYATIKASAPNSPLLVALSSQISALEERIRKEEHLGSSKVKSVTAETLAEYQKLETERQAVEKQYAEAVALRTQAYLTAQNQQSYLALFAAPALPQASLYPNRPRAILTVVLSAAVAWFVGMLVVYALRDHLV